MKAKYHKIRKLPTGNVVITLVSFGFQSYRPVIKSSKSLQLSCMGSNGIKDVESTRGNLSILSARFKLMDWPCHASLGVTPQWLTRYTVVHEPCIRASWSVDWPNVNPCWPSDDIWQQRYGSTLAQEMACCLIVEAEMSQKLSWRDLFVQIELGVDIASLGIK